MPQRLDIQRAGIPPHPWVYMDHWALRLFSDELVRGGRMLRVLSRGTLLISSMSLLEVARMAAGTKDHSTTYRILNFLEAAGAHWAILDINIGAVSRREEAGESLPWLDDEWCVNTRRKLGCISLAPLFGRTTQPWNKGVLESWDKDAAEVMHLVEAARARVRDRSLHLDGKPLPGSSRTQAVFEVLLQKLTKSDLPLDRNQLDDLLHACVPLAHADLVFLDKRWPGLLARHPLGRKVFQHARVDDALFRLESDWPAVNVQSRGVRRPAVN